MKVDRGSSSAQEEERLFLAFRRSRDPGLRDQLIQIHTPLVHALAARFAHRGEPLEDLIQVGMLALIHAIDRFEPERGIRFSSFAVPTIVGEIKRYFRDQGWHLKVPRQLRERQQEVLQATEALSRQLGRLPTVQEIAERIGANAEQVLEAMELEHAGELVSLDSEVTTENGSTSLPLSETLGAEDPNLAAVERRIELDQAMAPLDPRSREILDLLYFRQLSQSEVAKRLGISQMQVSRLQRRALDRLKGLLTQAKSENPDAAARG